MGNITPPKTNKIHKNWKNLQQHNPFTFCIEAISSFAIAFLLIYFYKPTRFCLHLCKCIWKMSTMHLLTSQRVYVYWLYTYTNERGKHCKNFPQNVTLLVQCLFYINPLIAKHDPCHTPVPKRWQLILRNKHVYMESQT